MAVAIAGLPDCKVVSVKHASDDPIGYPHEVQIIVESPDGLTDEIYFAVNKAIGEHESAASWTYKTEGVGV